MPSIYLPLRRDNRSDIFLLHLTCESPRRRDTRCIKPRRFQVFHRFHDVRCQCGSVLLLRPRGFAFIEISARAQVHREIMGQHLRTEIESVTQPTFHRIQPFVRNYWIMTLNSRQNISTTRGHRYNRELPCHTMRLNHIAETIQEFVRNGV